MVKQIAWLLIKKCWVILYCITLSKFTKHDYQVHDKWIYQKYIRNYYIVNVNSKWRPKNFNINFKKCTFEFQIIGKRNFPQTKAKFFIFHTIPHCLPVVYIQSIRHLFTHFVWNWQMQGSWMYSRVFKYFIVHNPEEQPLYRPRLCIRVKHD